MHDEFGKLIDRLGDVVGDIDWGSFPAYFGAIALVLTTLTIRRDHLARRHEQADQVAAWAENSDQGWVVKVKNASNLPIKRLNIGLAGSPRNGGVRLTKYEQDDDLTGRVRSKRVDVLGPDSTRELSHPSGPITVTSIEFLDAAGRYWRRRRDGKLIEVPAPGSLRARAQRLRFRLQVRLNAAIRRARRLGAATRGSSS
ncbi:hypothetical protein [Nocardioides exalbidus]|uniref:hypothetical protein n=1 Tax=Nocardioides exalbidus TaxID=402596 RepID=UPI0011150C37|nr:hypothetical protein [Nocardioides exalbidus]